MTLLDEIRAEQAKLEALRRRKGLVTVAMVREALPPFLRNQATSYQFGEIVANLNRSLDEAAGPMAQATDHQARASGEE